MNVFVHRLNGLAHLTSADRRAVERAAGEVQVVAAGLSLGEAGASIAACRIIVDGLACCHRSKAARRQILGFHVAGDIIDLSALLLGRLDRALGTVTACRIVEIDAAELRMLIATRPQVALAIWRHTLIDAAINREWLLSLGRRSAYGRIAHLFCELSARLRAAGLSARGRYRLGLSQAAVADATGLSEAHVNRILQQLRGDRMLTYSDGVLEVLESKAMARIGDFDGGYLKPTLAP